MKIPLKISILLNVLALGGLVFWVAAGRKINSSPVAPARQTDPGVSQLTLESSSPKPAAPPVIQPVPAAPFHWNQLYSKDYHVYVKNLRAVGCPEPTLRAIVTADVASVYQILGNQLEQKLTALANSSWSDQFKTSDSGQALKDELQKMPDEEAAKITDLLGLKPALVQVATTSPAPARPASLPLVMQNVDLSSLNLSAEEKQLIANMRQNLLQQIGGSTADPNNPANLAQLQKAQPEMDDILKSMLGTSAYQDYQLQAANVPAGSAGQP
jgi:hypothetical protein